MSCWLLVSAFLMGAIAVVAPQQINVILNKLLLATLAAWLGYWLSVSAFPSARPGHLLYLIDHLNANARPPNEWELLLGRLAATSILSRAILMGTCMLAVSLGI
jgi:Putative 2/3 transmembrane domain holin